MYSRSLNAKRLSHFQAVGPDYNITFIEDAAELATLDQPFTLLGAGTNRLWLNPQHSPLISLKPLNHVHFRGGSGLVTVGAGATLPIVINQAKEKGLGGLAFTWPIPASLGGALAQNFGAYQSQIGTLVRSMTVYSPLTQTLSTLSPETGWFSYRQSRLKTDGLVLIEATLQLKPMDPSHIQTELDAIRRQRTSRYPLHHTCGSVFQNPSPVPAGKLLEDCGLKGFRMGPVHTAEGHANIIVADSNATTQDIADLIQHLQRTVLDQVSVALELELAVY